MESAGRSPSSDSVFYLDALGLSRDSYSQDTSGFYQEVFSDRIVIDDIVDLILMLIGIVKEH